MPDPDASVLLVRGTDVNGAAADALSGADLLDVTIVDDAAAALDALDDTVDCVVSGHEIADDAGVRFRGGLRLLRCVRERSASPPFVFFTTVDNEELARTAIAADVTDYVTWNDDLDSAERLVNRVEHAVARKRAERRALRQQRINDVIREVNQALVRADDGPAMETAVCNRLTATDTYVSAFVGDVVDDAFETRVADDDPAVASDPPASACGGGVTVSHARDAAWVADRVAGGAAATVPVAYTDGAYGYLVVATDRPGAFDDEERTVLAELGETIAHALDAAEAHVERERQNERLEHMASVLSHDLRNPLQVAIGSIFALDEEIDSEHIDRTQRALDRMDQLVDEVLALARGSGRDVHPTTCSLSTVATRAWETVDTGDAVLSVGPDLGTVEAEETRFVQLFENLFRNAVEHGSTIPPSSPTREDAAGASSGEHSVTDVPEDADEQSSSSPDSHARQDAAEASAGDHVTVTVEATASGFAVADDGPGIPPEDHEDVFDPTYSTAPSGTGLGLAIVHDVATDHGWTVTACESESGGARFEFECAVDPSE